YFVFYAVNGFFQHSNVDARLGPLNWLVAGPELHRWHHSRIVRESNTNFGNNLIVWDALFGTRYLPERQVGVLGLLNRAYPKDFLGQTLAPVTVDPSRDSDAP
ncbi:MAG: sterol desaturase family protein, partial [Paracoccaceae bacterium]